MNVDAAKPLRQPCTPKSTTPGPQRCELARRRGERFLAQITQVFRIASDAEVERMVAALAEAEARMTRGGPSGSHVAGPVGKARRSA